MAASWSVRNRMRVVIDCNDPMFDRGGRGGDHGFDQGQLVG
jgi:hypothetical protein